ncbi:MAG: hypothetical protein QOF85_2619 [Solirubrobacterales bacterium]|nr:hypothetical protein [Solirubrobacterales bacterium]
MRLTSLLLVEERLLEAEYFLKRMARERGEAFGYNLNAFLSAARSVTFLLQKEYSKIDGFAEWWALEQARLAADSAARFFVELRNYSQKEGRVSVVGTAMARVARRSSWSHRFAGTAKAVPSVLLNRDVVDCGREHLGKLAQIVLRFGDRFPFYSCPKRALTPDGVRALGIDLDDIEAARGFPRGWTRLAAVEDFAERIKVVATLVDPVDFGAIERIARAKARRKKLSDDNLGDHLTQSMVLALERRRNVAEGEHILTEFAANEILSPTRNASD